MLRFLRRLHDKLLLQVVFKHLVDEVAWEISSEDWRSIPLDHEGVSKVDCLLCCYAHHLVLERIDLEAIIATPEDGIVRLSHLLVVRDLCQTFCLVIVYIHVATTEGEYVALCELVELALLIEFAHQRSVRVIMVHEVFIIVLKCQLLGPIAGFLLHGALNQISCISLRHELFLTTCLLQLNLVTICIDFEI